MRFSIIGCQHGHIGIFIKEMINLGHECVGIYEKQNVKLAESVSQQYDVKLLNDMEEALEESIEIVGCAEINNKKIDVIELCEEYGKHVMLDKPAATNRVGLERLKDVIKRGNIQVGMLLTERFRSSIFTLKEMIDQGDLGDVINISMRKPHRLTPEKRPLWHFSKEQCGGIVIDLFIHDFDLLRWLTGKEVLDAHGYMAKNILPEYPDFYDSSSLHIQMEDNILAHLYADWFNPEKSWTWGDCRIFVTGTKGIVELRLEGDPLASKEELLLKVTNEEEFKQVNLHSPFLNITEDFLNRLAGESSILSHDDILTATQHTIEADEKVKVMNRFH
ncbi:Gfo/Idh/MocA family protein [Pontibacillus sp. HMF3514]|uniref:Gfo/Idh/MocA family protein n=1 Tax=Pontibacillus sp. HMF3514 TaxID=2692425 RepID=UPI001F3A7651|nr:Gfo/Idh/MocA family oxidoreductase [Pontibacillus sp. HMF3514]